MNLRSSEYGELGGREYVYNRMYACYYWCPVMLG
jgi:hypothetical protein